MKVFMTACAYSMIGRKTWGHKGVAIFDPLLFWSSFPPRGKEEVRMTRRMGHNAFYLEGER